MSGKSIRLSRIFNPISKKAVIIPVDHGLIMGNIEGLKDPLKVLKILVNLEIDATLMGPGLGKLSTHLFEGKNAPGRILTLDFPLISNIPGNNESVLSHEPAATIEFAIRWGFDVVKILFPWCTEREVISKTIKLISNFANECDKWSIPLMIEPVLWGNAIPNERKSDPELIGNAARIAMELGADIIKMPYTGSVETFAKIVEELHIPVVVLGGPKSESIRDVLTMAKEAITSGAKGIVFGRNVWQYPEMEKLVKTLKSIVHNDMNVEDAINKYDLK